MTIEFGATGLGVLVVFVWFIGAVSGGLASALILIALGQGAWGEFGPVVHTASERTPPARRPPTVVH